MNEIWKPIKDFETAYEVSNLGRVKSLARERKNGTGSYLHKERILKHGISSFYYNVCLKFNGKTKTRNVHQLVAEAFLNHKPCGFKLVVNHKDFNKLNNCVENLEIVTQRENSNKKHLKSKSIYTGVYWIESRNKWISRIQINGKIKNLGYFKTEKEASEYYQNALKSHLNNEEIIVKKPVFYSCYKGVSWNKNTNKWMSQIIIKGKKKHLGYFKTEIEAHQAYKNQLLTLNK